MTGRSHEKKGLTQDIESRLQRAILSSSTADQFADMLATCLRVIVLSRQITALVEPLLDDKIHPTEFKALLNDLLEKEGA